MLKECKVCGQLKEFGSRSRAATCSDCLLAGYKYCSKCETVRQISSFYTNGLYVHTYCKDCEHDRSNAYRKTASGKASTRAYHTSLAGRCSTRSAMHRFAKTEHGKQVFANASHRRRGAEGTVTAEEWQGVLIEFNHECAYCGSSGKLTQDHIVAISVGGTNTVTNLVPACQHCNSSKNALNMHDWYSKQHFFNIDRYNKILHHMEVK